MPVDFFATERSIAQRTDFGNGPAPLFVTLESALSRTDLCEMISTALLWSPKRVEAELQTLLVTSGREVALLRSQNETAEYADISDQAEPAFLDFEVCQLPLEFCNALLSEDSSTFDIGSSDAARLLPQLVRLAKRAQGQNQALLVWIAPDDS